MLKFIVNFLTKHKAFIVYISMSFCTLLVYLISRFSVRAIADVITSLVIGHLVAVTFAYFVYKNVVFKTKNDSFFKDLEEMLLFYFSRSFSVLADIFIAWFFVRKYGDFFIHHLGLDTIDYTLDFFKSSAVGKVASNAENLNEFIFTFVSQIIMFVINYLMTSFVIFRKNTPKKSY